MDTTGYLRVLKGFWWLPLLGVVFGLIVAVEVVYSVHFSIPPTLRHRQHATYTASALVLVNSTANPYLRTGVTNVVPRPPKNQAVRSTKGQGGKSPQSPSQVLTQIPQPPSVTMHAPDTHTLVQAANLFPLLIESDQIAVVRKQMFGDLTGTVTAKALYSFVTPSRFKQSAFPIIQISATAPGHKAAVKLAQDTTLAFQHWLIASQNASGVPYGQRILVQELQAPHGAIRGGGTKKSVPLAVGFLVFAAFVGLAFVLDRLFPVGTGAPALTPALESGTDEQPAELEPGSAAAAS